MHFLIKGIYSFFYLYYEWTLVFISLYYMTIYWSSYAFYTIYTRLYTTRTRQHFLPKDISRNKYTTTRDQQHQQAFRSFVCLLF